MTRFQFAEARGEECDTKPVRRADANRAGDRDRGVAYQRPSAQHFRLHALGGQKKFLPGASQLCAGWTAQEKLGAEFRFKCGQTAGDGGVVQPQPPRRAEDLSCAGDGEEDADVVPVHYRFHTSISAQ